MKGPEEGAESLAERLRQALSEAGVYDTDERLWRSLSGEWVDEATAAALPVLGAELARYRLAWLSARRRAAQESVYAAEALAMRDAEIATLRASVS